MGLKGQLWKWIGRATGNHIFRSLPRGVDVFHDIAKDLPQQRFEIFFDVGANIGQSAQEYTKKFPSARIVSFEPVPATFKQLQKNLTHFARVRCVPLALASRAGQCSMLALGTSPSNRLVSTGEPADSEKTISVEQQTLDHFCDTEKISHIHYLKIDTEGADLDVLRGAEKMLAQQNIDLVQVEAGMNPRNTHHVPFEELKKHLEQHDYFLFGIYEQRREIFSGEPHLRRTNCVFVSRQVIEANRKLTPTRNHDAKISL